MSNSAQDTLAWVAKVNQHVEDGHKVALQVVIYCSTCGEALGGPVKAVDE